MNELTLHCVRCRGAYALAAESPATAAQRVLAVQEAAPEDGTPWETLCPTCRGIDADHLAAACAQANAALASRGLNVQSKLAAMKRASDRFRAFAPAIVTRRKLTAAEDR